MGNKIVSTDNKKLKDYKSLYETSGIYKHNKIIITGKKIVDEVINDNLLKNMELFSSDEFDDNLSGYAEMKQLFLMKKSLFLLSKGLFNELDLFKTRYPIIVASLPEMRNWEYKVFDGCTVLLPFQNPINIGSAIRSAAALGVKKAVILKDAASPFHPKAIRASSGSVFKIELYSGPSINEIIINHKSIPNLITLDMSGQSINKFSFPDNFFLLPGVEGQGLPNKIRKQSLSIPMEQGIESLNASVSVSIVLWEWKRRKII